VHRLIEAVLPTRFGTDFRRLFGAAVLSNTGDGLALAAGGLLVATQTRDPGVVALAALLQRLPWLLFGLHAGVVADRFDRRVVIGGANLGRAVVLAGLCLAIATDRIGVGVVLGCLFLLGVAEVLVDTTTVTLLPMVVESEHLGVANARLVAVHFTVNQLVGPPLGAALFALAPVWPFALQAAGLVGAAALFAGLRRGRPRPRPPAPTPAETSPPTQGETAAPSHAEPSTGSATAEIIEGIRWLWGHPPIRTLTITIVAFNLTFGAAWSVLVLLALERLGLGELGFGLLVASSAVGGLVATGFYGRLERRVSMATMMRTGLIIETVTHLVLAVATSAIPVFMMLFVFGMHISVWTTIVQTIRQRAVPEELQGRIGSVYGFGLQGGLVVGAGLGAALADRFGVTGPYWFGFIGSAILVAVLWNALQQVAAEGEPTPAGSA
jgi:MFS family permease